MQCPKCGKEMELGGFITGRGDSCFFWVPMSFTQKHWFNLGGHRKKTIENGGGLSIKAYSNMAPNATSYCCRDCQLFLVDTQ